MALWGGRFQEPTNEFFAAYSSSFAYDRRLLPYDLRGSKAWAFALVRAGILELQDARSIARGLRALGERARKHPEGWVTYNEQTVRADFTTSGRIALRTATQADLTALGYTRDLIDELSRKKT